MELSWMTIALPWVTMDDHGNYRILPLMTMALPCHDHGLPWHGHGMTMHYHGMAMGDRYITMDNCSIATDDHGVKSWYFCE